MLFISFEFATFNFQTPLCEHSLYPVVPKLLPSPCQPFLLLAENSSHIEYDQLHLQLFALFIEFEGLQSHFSEMAF